MTIIPVEEAQSRLPELIRQLVPGEEILISENDRTVARLVGARPARRPKLGTMKGTVLYVAPDFDAPLEDFREYME